MIQAKNYFENHKGIFLANTELVLCLFGKYFIYFFSDGDHWKFKLNENNAQENLLESLSWYKLTYSTKIHGKLRWCAELAKLILVKSKSRNKTLFAFISVLWYLNVANCCNSFAWKWIFVLEGNITSLFETFFDTKTLPSECLKKGQSSEKFGLFFNNFYE